MMAEQKTPENIKVQSRTEAESAPPSEPTPKGEKRPLAKQQHIFMSPTDALTSPCTQKLINLHRLPRRNARPIPGSSLVAPPISRPISKLANKENQLDTDKENDEVVPDDNVDNPVVTDN